MITEIINSVFLRYALVLLSSYICAIIVYIKINKISFLKLSFFKRIIVIVSVFIIPCLCAYLRIIDFSLYRLLFMVLMFAICLLIQPNKYYIIIPRFFISLGISYVTEIICIVLLGTVFYLLGYREINLITESCSFVLQILFTILFLRIKRTKNGFGFLETKKNFGISFLIVGPIIILTTLQKEHLNRVSLILLLIGLIISTMGLIIGIRNLITNFYKKRLKLRADEYSKIELAEKQGKIEKLLNENTSLSSIIHLDNHIIQTVETELKKLNSPEATEKLLTSINQRNEYVNDVLIKSKNLPSTGSAEIDAFLADLYIKAASRGIDYNLNVDCDINYLLNNLISKDDFEILLREIITNSIVSVENNPDTPGRILINISQPNDIYELTIMDNGVAKDENIESISDIIERSKASIKTNEFDNNDSFTKSLTIRFDGLGEII